jgi:hypothetical protein
MSSYRQHVYHLVIRTKRHFPTIKQDHVNELYAYNNRSLFIGWEDGYGSFTCSYYDINRLIEYIKNQKDHHKKMTFEEEYRIILLESGITPNEKYFP